MHKDICRACLLKSNEFIFSFFNNVDASLFMFCTSVMVTEDDSLSKKLCNKCYDKLQELSIFKQQCIESNQKLTEFLNNSNLDIVKNDPDFAAISVKLKKKSFDHKMQLNIVKTESHMESIYNDFGNQEEGATHDSHLRNANHIKINNINNVSLNFDIDCEIASQQNNSTNGEIAEHKIEVDKNNGLIFPKSRLKALKKDERHKLKIKELKILQFSCKICYKIFMLEEELEAHTLTVHEGQECVSIKCKLCDKEIKSWRGLKQHKAVMHKSTGEEIQCGDCYKMFSSARLLLLHRRKHSSLEQRCPKKPPGPVVCHVCGKTVKSQQNLKVHMDIHKANRERVCVCPECGKRFHNMNNMKIHALRQHRGRQYCCSLCCASYTDKTSLTRHILAHQGIKPYQCNICQKSYVNSSYLAEHRRIHTGERPFACQFCPKAFPSKKRMVEHIRTHTGERPYKCNKCEQAFVQRGTLVRHIKIHNKYLPSDKKSKGGKSTT